MIGPLAVAVHGVRQAGDVTGQQICVIGAGPIGNLVAQAAKGMGAARVMITDISDYRLQIAREMLLEGTAPTETAAACGFRDYPNFYRAFRARYDCSPRDCARSGGSRF